MFILICLSTEEICIDLESYKVEGPIEEISRKFAMNQVRAEGQARSDTGQWQILMAGLLLIPHAF